MDPKYRIVSAILFALIAGVIAAQPQIAALVPQEYAFLVALIFIVLREVVKEYGQKVEAPVE